MNTKMVIVAVSITSRERSERKIDFELSKPKQPMIINKTIGKSLIFSGVSSIRAWISFHINEIRFFVKQMMQIHSLRYSLCLN